MKARWAILGCGYIGTVVAKKMIHAGVEVDALTRNEATAESLAQLGCGLVVVEDIASNAWHKKIRGVYTHVLVAVGATSGDEAGYRHSYVEGNRSALTWAESQPDLRAFLYTGSTAVYPPGSGEWFDERLGLNPTTWRQCVLLEAERVVLEEGPARCSRTVLRLGGIYGPGRHALLDRLRASEPMSGNPDGYVNLIHRDDAATAIVGLGERFFSSEPRTAEVFNLTDGNPATRQEIADWTTRRLHLPAPVWRDAASEYSRGNRRICSDRLWNRLGRTPGFPSFREGYEALIATGS